MTKLQRMLVLVFVSVVSLLQAADDGMFFLRDLKAINEGRLLSINNDFLEEIYDPNVFFDVFTVWLDSRSLFAQSLRARDKQRFVEIASKENILDMQISGIVWADDDVNKVVLVHAWLYSRYKAKAHVELSFVPIVECLPSVITAYLQGDGAAILAMDKCLKRNRRELNNSEWFLNCCFYDQILQQLQWAKRQFCKIALIESHINYFFNFFLRRARGRLVDVYEDHAVLID